MVCQHCAASHTVAPHTLTLQTKVDYCCSVEALSYKKTSNLGGLFSLLVACNAFGVLQSLLVSALTGPHATHSDTSAHIVHLLSRPVSTSTLHFATDSIQGEAGVTYHAHGGQCLTAGSTWCQPLQPPQCQLVAG